MKDKKLTKKQVKEFILNHFHLDRLCPKCNSPIEVDNNVTCKMCSVKRDIKIQIDIADTAIHSMKMTIGK